MKSQFANRLRSNKGFSIVEVLVAATVFLVGFSVLVSLSGSAAGRFSSSELIAATQLADEQMLLALSASDTTDYEREVEVLGLPLLVTQEIALDSMLAKNTLTVMWPRTRRVVMEIYCEYPATQIQ